jgi:hypothetical protein
MMKAVRKHAQERWMELYIERWLKAPAQEEDRGTVEAVWAGTASGEDEDRLLQGCQPARDTPEREV